MDSYLVSDSSSKPIQCFKPMAALSIVPQTINAAATFTLDNNSNPPRSEYRVIRFKASGDVQVYFNSDTTKYYLIDTDTIALGSGVTSVNFKNAGGSAVTLYLWGM